MPKGAKVLSFQVQLEQLTFWALVNENAPLESRDFIVAGTGRTIPKALEDWLHYIGTAQQAGGALVWHLFEATPAKVAP